MPGRTKVEKHIYDLIEHMLNIGWEINHSYLENINKDDDLAKMIWGRVDSSFYLISKCKNYTARFENKRLYINQKPKGVRLGSFPAGKVYKINNGISYTKNKGIKKEIIEFVLE